MIFNIIGIIDYSDKDKRMLKIIGRTNTVTLSCEIEHPGGKIGVQEVLEVIEAEMNIKAEDIRIPLHIKEQLKGKE